MRQWTFRKMNRASPSNAALGREANSRKRQERMAFYERYYMKLPLKVAAHHMGITERTIRRYRKAIEERQETT
jgi:DNA-directed RNA polymerase specialized sigma24 family protein